MPRVRPSRAPRHMPDHAAGYNAGMGLINRIMTAVLTLVTAPFRALAALFGGTGRRRGT